MAATVLDSPFGPIRLVTRAGALVQLSFGAIACDPAPEEDATDAVLEQARQQLVEWFALTRREFDLPLAPAGTAFQRRVWAAMTAIPYGATCSYGDLASAVGTGPRAIGGACSRNPLPILVPCHRVVGRTTIGGFSAQPGVTLKEQLLAHEHAGCARSEGLPAPAACMCTPLRPSGFFGQVP